jgi:two-component system cell cycle response regulator
MTARILVVDDIQANLHLLEARLRAEYYEVRLANSGEAALREAAAWRPDIVLLDVMMPGMDGYETCRRLKADRTTADVPVVMVTALTDQSERVQGLEAGADDFLSKPVDDATLFARLRALMRTKQVEDAWRLRAETARGLGFESPPPPGRDITGAHALVVAAAQCQAVAHAVDSLGPRRLYLAAGQCALACCPKPLGHRVGQVACSRIEPSGQAQTLAVCQ